MTKEQERTCIPFHFVRRRKSVTRRREGCEEDARRWGRKCRGRDARNFLLRWRCFIFIFYLSLFNYYSLWSSTVSSGMNHSLSWWRNVHLDLLFIFFFPFYFFSEDFFSFPGEEINSQAPSVAFLSASHKHGWWWSLKWTWETFWYQRKKWTWSLSFLLQRTWSYSMANILKAYPLRDQMM